jgi:hypothetical protein
MPLDLFGEVTSSLDPDKVGGETFGLGHRGKNPLSIPRCRREEADRHWPFKGMSLHDHAW